MTSRDDAIAYRSMPSKLVTLLLVMMAQLVAALMIGSVALAVSFGPVQSAEARPQHLASLAAPSASIAPPASLR